MTQGKTISTVGCGDYLLACFLKGLKNNADVKTSLQIVVKVATLKAWGRTERKTWQQTLRQLKVKNKGSG